MVFNQNQNCFESNEFLEMIKKRNKSTGSIQKPVFLLVKEKIQYHDTLFIPYDSSTYKNNNNIKTEEKSTNSENIQDVTLLTEKLHLNILNVIDNKEKEENILHQMVSDDKTNYSKLDSTNKLDLDICIKDINIANISKNKEDDLNRIKLSQNENFQNIENITGENTLFNKKISFTWINIDKDRNRVTNHNIENTRQKRTVTFREELNLYVYIDEIKINNFSSAILSNSIEKNNLVVIYSQYFDQMTDYRNYLFTKTTLKNFKKKPFDEMKMSYNRKIDIIRPKRFTQIELKKDIRYILENTKVSIMKDVCYSDQSMSLGNHFFIEKNLNLKYRIKDRKKDYLALPYYKYSKEKYIIIENKNMISYFKTDDKDDLSNRFTKKLAIKNEITVRKRNSGFLKEIWKNIDSTFDFIARTAIKLCCCQ